MTNHAVRHRIELALEFIEAHLREDLRVEIVAGVAAYSPWHFQRLFSAIVGETVASYIRRRRLAAALDALLASRRPIVEIAWEHGFESQEAFTRAFKAAFGMTPGRCRRQGRACAPTPAPRLTPAYLATLFEGEAMEPVIKEHGPIDLVGIGSNFISIFSADADNNVVIPGLWDELMRRSGEVPNRIDAAGAWGLCAPIADEARRRHEDEFYYLAGLEVSSLDQVPEGMTARRVPAATYAVFTHTGPLDRLGETMRYIYGTWLPTAGYEQAEGPDLELYDKRFDPTSPTSEMEIWLPVKGGRTPA